MKKHVGEKSPFSMSQRHKTPKHYEKEGNNDNRVVENLTM